MKELKRSLGAGDLIFDNIFKRLEDRYGDSSRITVKIINSITKFEKIENVDNKRIVDFIGLIKRAYHGARDK